MVDNDNDKLLMILFNVLVVTVFITILLSYVTYVILSKYNVYMINAGRLENNKEHS